MEGKGKGATRLFLRGGIHEKGKRAWLFIFDVYINSISRAKASEQLHFRWTWTLFRCGDCGRQLYGQNEIADWRLFRSSWSFHSCSHPWFRSLPSIRRIFLPSCSSRFKFHPRIRFRVNAFFFSPSISWISESCGEKTLKTVSPDRFVRKTTGRKWLVYTIA